MTKSTGVGRGGKRAGAGAKPRGLVKKALTPEVQEQARLRIVTLASLPPEENPASSRVRLAYETLEDVMQNSPFPAPRVTAARAIIDLAKEEQARADSSTLGKKKQAKVTAEARATGRFAAPAPPLANRTLQ